jgi:hypothetical protein
VTATSVMKSSRDPHPALLATFSRREKESPYSAALRFAPLRAKTCLLTRIEDLNPVEVLRVRGDDDAIVGQRYGGCHHIDRAATTTAAVARRHKVRPFQHGLGSKREYPAREERVRPVRAGEPNLERIPTPSRRHRKNAAANLAHGEGRYEEAPIILGPEPVSSNCATSWKRLAAPVRAASPAGWPHVCSCE